MKCFNAGWMSDCQTVTGRSGAEGADCVGDGVVVGSKPCPAGCFAVASEAAEAYAPTVDCMDHFCGKFPICISLHAWTSAPIICMSNDVGHWTDPVAT